MSVQCFQDVLASCKAWLVPSTELDESKVVWDEKKGTKRGEQARSQGKPHCTWEVLIKDLPYMIGPR